MRNRKPEVEGAAAISRKNKRKEVAKFKLPGIWGKCRYWREFGKRKRFGRRQGQNSEGRLFYIGKPDRQHLEYGCIRRLYQKQ